MAKLFFHYSVMNAGKSTHLLQTNHNYTTNGHKTVVLTSVTDNRAGIGKIYSRMGFEIDALPIAATDNIYSIISQMEDVRVVLVDEIQFFTPRHVEELSDVADLLGIPVMTYGLKNNYKGSLFNETIVKLMAMADQIKEIKQLCHCGSKATMILKHDSQGNVLRFGEIVEIGSETLYSSVCRKHWKSGEFKNVPADHSLSK